MKINITKIYTIIIIFFFFSCDKKNDDLVKPLSASEFPQVIILSDEGDGDLEDEDKFSFKITLSDRTDPDGDELGGKVVPLKEAVTVQFRVKEFEGFSNLSDYILDAEAFYEIDDCTTSLDQGVDLNLQFDAATGIGSVTFPPDVEEIEIEFETDDALFDDNIFNTDERSVTIELTGITGGNGIAVNKTAGFKYSVQDDEGIYGEWKLDVSNPVAFSRFKELFGLINEDIKNLDAADVDEIVIAFEFEEVKAIIVLKETEQVDECGTPDVVNKIIEIEAEIEELSDEDTEGDVEFGETLELSDGSFKEFAYAGIFKITGNILSITLEGEFDDDTTNELTLELEK
jgi:hypothetical protein